MLPGPCFTLTINVRTPHFGETAAQERAGVAKILMDAAQQIRMGSPYQPIRDTGGHIVAEYEFSPAMINGPQDGYDDTLRHLPNAHALGAR